MAFLRALLGRLWRLAWQLSALALILLALYVSLGRELVPLAAEYRLEVEDAARQQGLALSIGRLEGEWQGLAPVLVAREVELGEGAARVHLDQLRITPAILGSLLARQLRIADLELQGLQLTLQEQADGRWALTGLPLRETAARPDPALLLQRLRQLERIRVRDSRLRIEPRDAQALNLTYLNLQLETGARLELQGRGLLPDGQPLALHLVLKPDATQLARSQLQAYLSLPQSDWAPLIPPRLLRDWRLQQLSLGGELWLDWSAGSLERAVARLHAPALSGARGREAPVSLSDLSFTAFYQRQTQGFELLLDGLALSHAEQRWDEMRIGLRRSHDAQQADLWQLRADRLELAPLAALLQVLAPLPEKPAEILRTLRPRGVLAHLRADYRPAEALSQRLHFSAGLDRVGVDAYLGSPALEQVSGRIEGGLARGEIRVDSHDLQLHFDKLFEQPWHYRRANALLHWHYDDEAFSLSSPYLRVLGEEGPLAGDFMIRLRKDPAAEDYMDLRVGLRDGDATHAGKYLPTRSPALSPALAEWLGGAIRGGSIEQGWFQYQGSLNKGAAPESRSLSLYFKVHDAELAYQPGWPALREARGEVFIEDSGVRVRVPAGRLLDSQVSDAQVDIPRQPGRVPRLALKARLDSSLQDALQVLQQAPTPASAVFAGWRGEGTLQGSLALELPLQRGGAAAHVQVDLQTRDARLQLASPTLTLERLGGAFRYDTRTGLSAPDIRAQVLGSPVRASAQALGRKGVAHTRLKATGTVAYPRLAAWLGLTQPLPLSGRLPYRLELDLDGADSRLRVESTLEGLAVALPEPFAKPAEQSRPSSLRMTLQGSERRYWAEYGELASLALAAPAAQLEDGRGELLLGGGTARLPTRPGLRLRGRLQRLDWAAWQALFTGRVRLEQQQARRLLAGGELHVEQFSGFGLSLEGLDLALARSASGWLLDIDSTVLKGRVGLPDTAGQPLDLALAYLRLPAPEKPSAPVAEEKADPLAGIDPRSLPALDVRIDKLWLGERPVGGWSFRLRPSTLGVELQDLSLGLRGALLSGNAAWEGEPGATRTRYQGRIEGANLADVLLAWDFAPSLSSQRFRLDVDGHWAGSPAAVSLKGFSGAMGGQMEQGQVRELEGGASALRVFGLLNFDSIGRRLRLDFSDMLGKGLSYDRLKVVLAAENGLYTTSRPLTLSGPSSNFELDGQIDMRNDSIAAKVLVTLPVSNNLPLAALIAGAPAVGGALFIADKLLGDQVARFASVQYDVQGPLANPQITFDKPFEKPR